jgi:hypothetical protein
MPAYASIDDGQVPSEPRVDVEELDFPAFVKQQVDAGTPADLAE